MFFQNYSTFLQGLIFVVDSNDRERIQEAAEELQKMVNVDTFYFFMYQIPEQIYFFFSS